MNKLRSIYEAVGLNTLGAQGCHKTLLVTRTSASVTILSSATPTPPPVQIVLHTYESIEELLSRFDVDCCACCFDMERFWMTPRCKRALEFKANVVDHSFSTSVCRALKGNANRSSDPLGGGTRSSFVSNAYVLARRSTVCIAWGALPWRIPSVLLPAAQVRSQRLRCRPSGPAEGQYQPRSPRQRLCLPQRLRPPAEGARHDTAAEEQRDDRELRPPNVHAEL